MDLDKPLPTFEHASLGPLPIDPKLIQLKKDCELWKRKYDEIFNEQCRVKSLETTLRNRCNEVEKELMKAKSMIDAQREIIEWLLPPKV